MGLKQTLATLAPPYTEAVTLVLAALAAGGLGLAMGHVLALFRRATGRPRPRPCGTMAPP
jgi:hypothetical protein